MKKLAAKKNVECMACLQCVAACSEAFYKEFDPDKACLSIIERNGDAHVDIVLIDDLISVHRAVERGEFRERFRDEFDQYVSIAHLDVIRLELGAVLLEIGHVHAQIEGDGGAGHMGIEHVARDSLAHAIHIHGLLAGGSLLLHRYTAVMQIPEDPSGR